MATHAVNLIAFNSNDADFRTWGAGVKAALAAIETLVQTADTGQIDWATVARPGATGTVAGYEIYRFDDTLQATKPVFVKLEYGTGGAVDRPSMWVTVGTGTNGAGTLTGQLSTRTNFLSPTASKTAGAVLPLRASGDASGFFLGVSLDVTNNVLAGFVVVDRPKRFDGTVSDKGVLVVAAGTLGYQQIVPFTGSVPAALSGNVFPNIRSNGLSSFGGDVAVVPLFTTLGEPLGCRVLFAVTVDIASMTTVTATYMGATRTLLALGAVTPARILSGSDSNYQYVVVFE